MDLTSIAATVSANGASQMQTAVGLSVLKKAMDIEADGALALVQSVSKPSPVAPGEQGGIINTTA
jgi:hypothetical protein